MVGATILRPLMVPPVTMAPEAGTSTRTPSALTVPVVWVITGRVTFSPRQLIVPAAVSWVKAAAAERL